MKRLLALISPLSPVASTGHRPFVLATMLRIHCLQQWFGLSDQGAEEALLETGFYCDFVGRSGTQRIPDRVSIVRFRHLVEEHDLSPKILQVINSKLAAPGLILKTGTVVDATLIAAPSPTKNSSWKRESEMHQTKKGNQWHFGDEALIGVDADPGLVHSVIGIAANVNDVTQGHGLLHGEETVVFADAGYLGAGKRPEATGVDWHVAMRPGKRKSQRHTTWGALAEQAEKSAPRWSMHFVSSSVSSVMPGCATVGSRKTLRNSSLCLRCPISGWLEASFCRRCRDECVRKQQSSEKTTGLS